MSLQNFNFEYQKLYIEFSFLYSEHMPLSYLQEENGELQLKHLFIKLHDSLLFSNKFELFLFNILKFFSFDLIKHSNCIK